MIDLDGTTAEEVELNIYYNSSIIRVFHSFSEKYFFKCYIYEWYEEFQC